MDERTLLAFARAYDREDAAQMGEPDPWIDGKDDPEWVSERLACASAALSAAAQPAPGVKELDDLIARVKKATDFFRTTSHHTTTKLLNDILEQVLFPLASRPTPAGESGREPAEMYNPEFVAELVAADAAKPEAEFVNATDMLAALAIPSSPAAWTDEAIVELAVAHSNYRDEAGFEVMSHARIVEFARELLAAPTTISSTGTDEPDRIIPAEPTIRMSAAGMRVIKNTEVHHFHKYAGGIANSVYDAMVRAFREESEHMGPTPASLTSPAQGTVERAEPVEALADFLCNEFDFDLNPIVGASWPVHPKDDGYRGDNAYVRLQPPDVQARARDNAKRILAFVASFASQPVDSDALKALREENERLKAKIESLEDNGTRLSDMLIEASQSERDDD